MDKKLTIDDKKKYVYEKICFTLLKLQLENCEDYGYTTLEDKVELFNFLVHVNRFVHKNKITGHKYDQDICCIENLLVKCNFHSPKFLALLIEKHRFDFDTDVLLEMLVKYADTKENSLQNVMYKAIKADLFSCEDIVFMKWLKSNEEKSTLIAKLLEEMDNFRDMGRFLNAYLMDYSEDPVNFVISVFNFDIKDTNGSIIPMVESLVCLSEQDKQALIVKLSQKLSLTSKGKAENKYETDSEATRESESEDDSEDNSEDDSEEYSEEENSDKEENSDEEDSDDESDIKPKNKRSVRGKSKTSATKPKVKKQRKLN